MAVCKPLYRADAWYFGYLRMTASNLEWKNGNHTLQPGRPRSKRRHFLCMALRSVPCNGLTAGEMSSLSTTLKLAAPLTCF